MQTTGSRDTSTSANHHRVHRIHMSWHGDFVGVAIRGPLYYNQRGCFKHIGAVFRDI